LRPKAVTLPAWALSHPCIHAYNIEEGPLGRPLTRVIGVTFPLSKKNRSLVGL